MDPVENPKPPADSPSCVLTELSAVEVHKNIMRCHALSVRVKRKLLDNLHILIEKNYSSDLGSSTPAEYVMTNLEYHSSEAYQVVTVARLLGRLPRSADAFEARALTWSHLKAIGHVLEEFDEAKEADWLPFALKHTARALWAEVMDAVEAKRTKPRKNRGGMPRTRHKIAFTYYSEEVEVVRKALELVLTRLRARRLEKEGGDRGGTEAGKDPAGEDPAGEKAEAKAKAKAKDDGDGAGTKGAGKRGKARKKHPDKEDALYEMCLEFLREQAEDGVLDESGKRTLPFTVNYTVCSICKDSHVLTSDGAEEVPHEHIASIAGEARTVTILPEDFMKGEALPYPVEGDVPAGVVRKVLAIYNNSCARCGCGLGIHIHHIVFKSLGGPHEVWNLIAVCSKCHSCIHQSTLEVFMDPLGELHWRTRAERITALMAEELEELAAIPSVVIVADERGKPQPAQEERFPRMEPRMEPSMEATGNGAGDAREPAAGAPESAASVAATEATLATDATRATDASPAMAAPATEAPAPHLQSEEGGERKDPGAAPESPDAAAPAAREGGMANEAPAAAAGNSAPEPSADGSGEKKASWSPDSPEYQVEAEFVAAAMVKLLDCGKKEARKRVRIAMGELAGLDRPPAGNEIFNAALRVRLTVFGASLNSARAENRREARGGGVDGGA